MSKESCPICVNTGGEVKRKHLEELFGDWPLDHPGVLDYDFITRRLAVGSMSWDLGHVEALQNMGITHVINCTRHTVEELYTTIKYYNLPEDDDGSSKPKEWFKEAIDIVLESLKDPKSKVYIHCAAGINRSASIVYAVLVAMGFGKAEANNRIRDLRPIVQLAYVSDANDALKQLGFV